MARKRTRKAGGGAFRHCREPYSQLRSCHHIMWNTPVSFHIWELTDVLLNHAIEDIFVFLHLLNIGLRKSCHKNGSITSVLPIKISVKFAKEDNLKHETPHQAFPFSVIWHNEYSIARFFSCFNWHNPTMKSLHVEVVSSQSCPGFWDLQSLSSMLRSIKLYLPTSASMCGISKSLLLKPFASR